jgi:RimJ/RimL family protein N-acetyltransferase
MIKQISKEQVKEILKDEELFNRISDDSMTYERFTPSNDIYLGTFKDDKLVGFFWLISDNAITLELHIQILKDYRHLSTEFSNEFFGYFIDRFNGRINKLTCKIPVTFKDVYGFAKKHGFSDEGLDRESVIKDGKIVDRHILGMTMKEIKLWVQ